MFLCILTVIACMTTSNVAGVWTGAATDNQGGRQGAYLQLQQEGSKITGLAGASREHAWPIRKAILADDHLTFSVTSTNSQTGEHAEWFFDLKIEGDRMTGTGSASRDDQSWEVNLLLTRQK